jgi:hypothetical protein
MQTAFRLIFDDFIFGIGVPLCVGAGFTMLADEFKKFIAAKMFFFTALIWTCGRIFMWSVFTNERLLVRATVTFLVFGVIGVGFAEAMRLTNHLASKKDDSGQEASTKPPIAQTSSGSNSPNILGNNNTVIISEAPPAVHPPKKGEKTFDIAESSMLTEGFKEEADPALHVRVGSGLRMSNSKDWLKKGNLFYPIAVGPEQFRPISVGMDKNGHLLLTCEVVGTKGARPFQIKIVNNVFDVASGFVQKNYNNLALEIADDNGVPLFQLIYESKSQFRINGVFAAGWLNGKEMTLWAWSDGTFVGTDLPKDFVLKPIFKYPSWKYLGQYAD